MIIDIACTVADLRSAGQGELRVLREQSSAAGVATIVVATASESTDLAWPLPVIEAVVAPRSGEPWPVAVVPCYDWRPGLPDATVEGLLAIPADLRLAVRCRPSGDWAGVVFQPWLVGSLPAILADICRPLIVDLAGADMPPYAGIFELCSSHARLPVVLSAVNRVNLPIVRALARACPNLMAATVGLGTDDVSALVADLGAHRVLFGSGYPAWSQVAALATIGRVDLDPAARELVVSGNARRLLAGEWTLS